MRTLITSVAGLAFVALSTFAPLEEAQAKPTFALEEYFIGKTVAKGIFESKVAKSRREFDVYLTGTWDGKTLRLREDFVYADGEKDRKTWVFTKVEEGKYIGTREDVVGNTVLTISGNVARFSYDVMIPRKGKKPIKVHFSDKMVLKPGGIVLNTARVSKFGLPIGKVAVNFAQSKNINDATKPSL